MMTLAEYIIYFYGFGIPFFYAIYKLTYTMSMRQKYNQEQQIVYNNEGVSRLDRIPKANDKPIPISKDIQLILDMKEIINNDNLSTQDRITKLKQMKVKK